MVGKKGIKNARAILFRSEEKHHYNAKKYCIYERNIGTDGRYTCTQV